MSDTPLLGGYKTTTPTAVDQTLARFAIDELGLEDLVSIDSVQRQVVAGVNVRMELTLADGARWRVVVTEKLDHTRELTLAEELGVEGCAG